MKWVVWVIFIAGVLLILSFASFMMTKKRLIRSLVDRSIPYDYARLIVNTFWEDIMAAYKRNHSINHISDVIALHCQISMEQIKGDENALLRFELIGRTLARYCP